MHGSYVLERSHAMEGVEQGAGSRSLAQTQNETWAATVVPAISRANASILIVGTG